MTCQMEGRIKLPALYETNTISKYFEPRTKGIAIVGLEVSFREPPCCWPSKRQTAPLRSTSVFFDKICQLSGQRRTVFIRMPDFISLRYDLCKSWSIVKFRVLHQLF